MSVESSQEARRVGARGRGFLWARLGMSVGALVALSIAASGCDDDGDGGNGTEPPPPTGACETHHDCARTEVCGAEGVCESAGTCGGPGGWTGCVATAERLGGAEAGAYYACVERQCERLCVADSDCEGEGEICTDFGRCVAFDGALQAFDSGSYEPGPLFAGVGEALLNVPIGIEMGGYGSRAKKDDGRFAASLSASQGQFDAQIARAVVLDNGVNRLMLLRAPLIFAFDQLHERVARGLQEATGHDWRDELVLSTTHTHSGPARYWRLPPDAAIDPGMLGAGAFNQYVEDWLVESLTAAALDAIAQKQPAKFGWKIVEAFDMDDHVGRDRWSSAPQFDMNRMLLMRVDDLTDEPLAVLFSYGAHGTENSGDYMTDDVLGGAERGLSEALSATYDRHVPALFFAENGGNMAPGAGRQGQRFPYSRERAGYVIAEKAMPVLMGLATEREVAFRSRAYRFNINYGALGYDPTEFRASAPRPLGGVYWNGALLCGGPNADDDDYATYIPQDQLNCITLSFILNNMQPSPLTRSQVMAIELDGLSIVTLPGESTQHVGWQVMRLLRDRFDVPTSQTWVLGYSNDHLLYIVPSNLRGEAPDVAGFVGEVPDSQPDYAFSFLQGGYEPGMAPWGPAFGDWLMDRVGEAFGWLQDPAAEPAGMPHVLPAQYSDVETPPFERDSTPSDRIGTILEDMPATLARMTPVTFTWVGGDSGAEAPQAPHVTLQVDDGDGWVPAVGPDFLPIDNRGHAMASRVKIVTDGPAPEYQWSVYWEATKSLPTGTYRFHVAGHHYDDALERVPYDVYSAEFALTPNTALTVQAEYESSGRIITGTILYPAMQSLEQNTGGERARLSGSLRLRDPQVPVHMQAPVVVDRDIALAGLVLSGNGTIGDVELTGEDCDAFETSLSTREGYSNVPSTRFVCTAPSGDVAEIVATDRFGNQGSTTVATP